MAEPNPEQDASDELPLFQFLTYRLSRVQSKLNAQAIRILREQAGLTLSQWRIIALVGASGQTRPSALTKDGLLDKGLLSRKLKPLIQEGLISSKPDETDHRAQLLSLTTDGRALYERTLPIMRRRQRGLRSALSASEIEGLYRALDKLELAAEQKGFP